jgi:hypothetical protein
VHPPITRVAVGPVREGTSGTDATPVRQQFIGTRGGTLCLNATIANYGFHGRNRYARRYRRGWSTRASRPESSGIRRVV